MKISEDDLHACVDDRLDLERRRAVEAELAQSPEDAARAAAYREQNAALHALYDPVLGEPVPEPEPVAVAPEPEATVEPAPADDDVLVGSNGHAPATPASLGFFA